MNRALILAALFAVVGCSNNQTQPISVAKNKAVDCAPNARVACKVSLITLTTDGAAWNGLSVEVAGFVSESGDALYLDRDSMEYGITQNAVGLVGFPKRKPTDSAFAQLSGTFLVNKYFGIVSLDNGPDHRFAGSIEFKRSNMLSYDPYFCVNGKGGPPDGTVRKLVGDNKCISVPSPATTQ